MRLEWTDMEKRYSYTGAVFSMYSSWGSRLCCFLEYASMIMVIVEKSGDDEADPLSA